MRIKPRLTCNERSPVHAGGQACVHLPHHKFKAAAAMLGCRHNI